MDRPQLRDRRVALLHSARRELSNHRWDRFLGDAPKRPFEPQRLFQWRNWNDYGTGVAGDLFVHLFSGSTSYSARWGHARVRRGRDLFWKGDRDAPDIMVGLYDYPKTDSHPAFNLALRVNFVCGGPETGRFHFTGSEGVMTIGDGVSVIKPPKETDPGETAGSFSRETAEKIMAQHRARYPEHPVTAATMPEADEEHYLEPRDYSDDFEHHTTFFNAVRSRRPVVEDATFGLRAAAGAAGEPELLRGPHQALGPRGHARGRGLRRNDDGTANDRFGSRGGRGRHGQGDARDEGPSRV